MTTNDLLDWNGVCCMYNVFMIMFAHFAARDHGTRSNHSFERCPKTTPCLLNYDGCKLKIVPAMQLLWKWKQNVRRLIPPSPSLIPPEDGGEASDESQSCLEMFTDALSLVESPSGSLIGWQKSSIWCTSLET